MPETWGQIHVAAVRGPRGATGASRRRAAAASAALGLLLVPASTAGGGAAGARATTRTAAGPIMVRASVTYVRRQTAAGPSLEDPRTRIARTGQRPFVERVPARVAEHAVARVSLLVGGTLPYFVLRDLDADGEPEVALTLSSGGARCCVWSRIYHYVATRRTYRAVDVLWGGVGSAPALRDLDRDARWELVAHDERFARLPFPPGEPVEPIRILAYDGGRLRVVTTRFPSAVATDAARLWALRARALRAGRSARPALLAWAADQRLLGRGRAAERALHDARLRGELAPLPEDVAPRAPRAWLAWAATILSRLGYPVG